MMCYCLVHDLATCRLNTTNCFIESLFVQLVKLDRRAEMLPPQLTFLTRGQHLAGSIAEYCQWSPGVVARGFIR